MSRKITYYCDKCGKDITDDGHRFTVKVTFVDGDCEYDLCPECRGYLHDWMCKGPEPEPQKKKAGRPKKTIDEGKVKSLHEAGWTDKDIAGDMHITEAQVRHALQFAEKKEAALQKCNNDDAP